MSDLLSDSSAEQTYKQQREDSNKYKYLATAGAHLCSQAGSDMHHFIEIGQKAETQYGPERLCMVYGLP